MSRGNGRWLGLGMGGKMYFTRTVRRILRLRRFLLLCANFAGFLFCVLKENFLGLT